MYQTAKSFTISRCSIRQYTCAPVARVTRISLRIGHRVDRKSLNARGWDNVCSEAAYRQVYTRTYTIERTCRHTRETKADAVMVHAAQNSLKFYMRCVMAQPCAPSALLQRGQNSRLLTMMHVHTMHLAQHVAIYIYIYMYAKRSHIWE